MPDISITVGYIQNSTSKILLYLDGKPRKYKTKNTYGSQRKVSNVVPSDLRQKDEKVRLLP